MSAEHYSEPIVLAAQILEYSGVLTILLGAMVALVIAARQIGRGPAQNALRSFRHGLGRSILLGLEFLVGADIIRTISEEPTPRHVLTLAMVVLIRTFLSFTLALELEGKWPWQRANVP